MDRDRAQPKASRFRTILNVAVHLANFHEKDDLSSAPTVRRTDDQNPRSTTTLALKRYARPASMTLL